MNKMQLEKGLKVLNALEETKELLELKEIMYNELNKLVTSSKNKKVNIYSFVKKFIKKKDMRDDFRGVIEQEGRFFLCDGVRLIEINEKPEGIKEVITKIDCISFMNNASENMVELDLTSEQLELECRTAEEYVIFEKEGVKHGFNPKLLLDFIKLNGSSIKIKLSIREQQAAFIEGDYPGLLMPIRL